MNCTQAKQININDYLSRKGFSPVKRMGSGTWYHSPISGSDHTPSFEVSPSGRAFHDWSSGVSGNILDLVMIMEQCTTIRSALQCLEKTMNGNVLPVSTTRPTQPEIRISPIKIIEANPITDRRLLAYAYSRGIPCEILRTYCVQLLYSNDGRVYTAIGFANDAGGYEIRNSVFKGASSPKDITVIGDLAGCPFLVFEGFFDFLSSVRLGWYDATSMNAIVLNSTKMLNHSFNILRNASEIWCFLDNDTQGRDAMKKIQCVRPDAQDKSFLFHQQKDLNEMLLRKRP